MLVAEVAEVDYELVQLQVHLQEVVAAVAVAVAEYLWRLSAFLSHLESNSASAVLGVLRLSRRGVVAAVEVLVLTM